MLDMDIHHLNPLDEEKVRQDSFHSLKAELMQTGAKITSKPDRKDTAALPTHKILDSSPKSNGSGKGTPKITSSSESLSSCDRCQNDESTQPKRHRCIPHPQNYLR